MVRPRRHRALALGCFAALAMTARVSKPLRRHCEERSDEANQSNRLVVGVDVFDVAGVFYNPLRDSFAQYLDVDVNYMQLWRRF